MGVPADLPAETMMVVGFARDSPRLLSFMEQREKKTLPFIVFW